MPGIMPGIIPRITPEAMTGRVLGVMPGTVRGIIPKNITGVCEVPFGNCARIVTAIFKIQRT